MTKFVLITALKKLYTSMKTAAILMCAISIATTMQAQTNIAGTREANAPDGKILTMEETILSKDLSPKDLHCRWVDDEHIAMFKDGKWLKYNIETEDTSSYRPERPRPFAYSKDRNLYLLDKDGFSQRDQISYGRNGLGKGKPRHIRHLLRNGHICEG